MDYRKINNERQFKAVTGLSKSEFADLLKTFAKAHEDIFGKLSDQIANGNKENRLKTYGDCLMFVLYQLKTNLTYDALGATFNMASSTAHTNFTKFSKILQIALKKKDVLPQREFRSKKEFEQTLKDEKEIIIDGEEQAIQRPKDTEIQRDMYSGKKKLHTDKTLVITNRRKWIYYISYIYCGKEHDFSILKTEFPQTSNWFSKFMVLLDLGFQGFEKVYACMKLFIPYKRKRTKKGEKPIELTPAQKRWNRLVSKIRIYVEHGIGGMKRYGIMGYKNRMKNYSLKNTIVGICAGLWNLKLKNNGY